MPVNVDRTMEPELPQLRYHYMDALRSFCMLFGVFLHAATIGDAAVFDWIGTASGFFRMATFFTIAGFFACMLAARSDFMQSRLVLIALPFTVVLLVLNPITNYLVYIHHNWDIPLSDYFSGSTVDHAKGPMVWHLHLWFLVSLFIYTLVTPTSRALVESQIARGWLAWLSGLPANVTIFLLASTVATGAVGARTIYELVIEPAVIGGPFAFIIRITFHYYWFFTLGVVLCSDKRLLEQFCQCSAVVLVLAAAGLLLGAQMQPILPKPVAGAVWVFGKTFATVAIVSAFFFLFRKLFDRENGMIRFWSDASYTVYLLHYFLIYALATLLAPLVGNVYLLYLLTVAGTYASALVFHSKIVRRFNLIRLLLNGRSMAKRPLQPAS